MTRAIFIVGAALLALAAAVPAAAAPGGHGRRIVFQLQGSHGYKVYAIGERSTGALVATRGRRPHRLGASASVYIGKARTGRRSFAVDLGEVGRVDVRFRPSGRVSRGRRRLGCRGPDRYTTHYGAFVGSVRFEGENGYTSVAAHRVKGRVVTPAVLECFGPPLGRRRATIWDALTSPPKMILSSRPSPEAISSIDPRSSPRLPHLLGGRGRRTSLVAEWRVGVAAQAFGVVERGKRRPVFFAGTLQTQERLAVVRLAAAVGTPADLLASDSLDSATVSPPAPFSGEGSFRHFDDGTKSWTGSLSVALPGMPQTPLTGSPFEVSLSRGF